MKIIIASDYEYVGKGSPPIETFSLTVEGEVGEDPSRIAHKYLELRRQLREGIKKEDK